MHSIIVFIIYSPYIFISYGYLHMHRCLYYIEMVSSKQGVA